MKKMKMHTRKQVGNIAAYTLLIVIGIAFAVPALWLLFAAFDPTATLAIKIPEKWTLENFKVILEKTACSEVF